MPPEQITALYVEHHHWLTGWLRARLRSHERASDLAQELFCRLLERPVSAEIERPRAFLATSAKRLLIDQNRRLAVEKAYLSALASLQDQHAPSAEAAFEAVEALTAIARMLEGLAERPRRAFLMSRLDGASHAEIAEALGVSASMVKQYVARALVHCYRIAFPP